MVFTYYHKHGIALFLGLFNTPPGCNPYVMEPNFLKIYDPKKGISHPLCNFRHKNTPLTTWIKII